MGALGKRAGRIQNAVGVGQLFWLAADGNLDKSFADTDKIVSALVQLVVKLEFANVLVNKAGKVELWECLGVEVFRLGRGFNRGVLVLRVALFNGDGRRGGYNRSGGIRVTEVGH